MTPLRITVMVICSDCRGTGVLYDRVPNIQKGEMVVRDRGCSQCKGAGSYRTMIELDRHALDDICTALMQPRGINGGQNG